MFKRSLGLLVLCTMLATATACGDEGGTNDVYTITDSVQVEEDSTSDDASSDDNSSDEGQDVLDGMVFSFEENGISKDFYDHIYKYVKNDELAFYQQVYSYYGSSFSVAVADTEAFWRSEISDDIRSYILYSDNGGKYTFEDVIEERVDNICKYILACEGLADSYDYNLETDYEGYEKGYKEKVLSSIVTYCTNYAALMKENNEKSANEALKGFAGCFGAVIESVGCNGSNTDFEKALTDKNGVVTDWAVERFSAYLQLHEGVSLKDWRRLYYDFSILQEALPTHLSEKGIIVADSNDKIKEELIKELEASLQSLLTDYVKFDYFFYEIATDDNFEELVGSEESKEESSSPKTKDAESEDAESSEESAEESSEEASEDEKNPLLDAETVEEYNAILTEMCDEIYKGLSDGSLGFYDEMAKSPYGDRLLSYYPDGMIVSKEECVTVLGSKVDDVAKGEIRMYTTDSGIHFIQMKEVTEADFGRDTVPTDEEIAGRAEKQLSEKYNVVFNEAMKYIAKDEKGLEKYQSPWLVK